MTKGRILMIILPAILSLLLAILQTEIERIYLKNQQAQEVIQKINQEHVLFKHQINQLDRLVKQ